LITVGGYRMLAARRPSAAARWFAVAASLVIVALGLRTTVRLGAYRTPVTLWLDAVRHQPNDAVAHTNLGTVLVDARRGEEAIPEFEQALLLEPDDTAAHNDLGALLSRVGREDEAIAHLQQALALRPDEPKAKAHMNLGNALLAVGRTDQALAQLEEAVR